VTAGSVAGCLFRVPGRLLMPARAGTRRLRCPGPVPGSVDIIRGCLRMR
jgi:hypothetical protein